MEADSLAAELDLAHARARDAYVRRDAADYMALFHPELQYAQRDGQTIGRQSLARDVRAQLARVYWSTTDFRRKSLDSLRDGSALEVLEQRATFRVRVFGILRREWTVRRCGEYEWERTASGWQIRRVDVLTEEVTMRTWLGLG